VMLEPDGTDRDDAGRLLRHVWVRDGAAWVLLSAELARRGLGTISTAPPHQRHASTLMQAQADAQQAGRAMWRPRATPEPTQRPRRVRNCDPSYPTVCIPRYPPDLDCDDVRFREFRVRGRDPHSFDGDDDGVGCEPAPPPRRPRPRPPRSRNCDPSYPGVCIPNYPPDLDCGDVAYEDFRVIGRDPHGFDGDNDGVGCES
jgi:hypothetical protein